MKQSVSTHMGQIYQEGYSHKNWSLFFFKAWSLSTWKYYKLKEDLFPHQLWPLVPGYVSFGTIQVFWGPPLWKIFVLLKLVNFEYIIFKVTGSQNLPKVGASEYWYGSNWNIPRCQRPKLCGTKEKKSPVEQFEQP